MKRAYFFLAGIVAAMQFAAINVQAANDLVELSNSHLEYPRIPLYDKDKLQLLVFAKKGFRQGSLINGTGIFIDMLLPNANVDKIPDGWSEKLYPLNASLRSVVNFWKRRSAISESVFSTPHCRIDQNNRVLFGETPVYMRSPMVDLDGIGFRYDLKTRVMEIHSEVNINVRTADHDPRVLAADGRYPASYTTIRANADSLRIDMLDNKFILSGKVRVVDGVNILTCDRLTVFLDPDKPGIIPRNQTEKNRLPDRSSMLKGVSRLLAVGNVVLIRRPESVSGRKIMQQAFCEYLDYTVASGQIVMTGSTRKMPLLKQDDSTVSGQRIELLRISRKAFILKDCVIDTPVPASAPGEKPSRRRITAGRAFFDGTSNMSTFFDNVVVSDRQMTLYCDRMRVLLKPVSTAGNNRQQGREVQDFSPVSGRREIDKIFCSGKLRIVGTPKNGSNLPRTISADRGNLDYSGNKISFTGSVHAKDGTDSLKCRRLDLLLANSNSRQRRNNSSAVAAGTPGQNKVLQKIIALGDVYMQSEKSDLSTTLLTMFFQELPPGVKPVQGMFHSGGVQLTRITCDGKVVAREIKRSTTPGTAPTVVRTLNANHAISDLIKDISEFHGDVVIVDANNLISCRDMYVYTGKVKTPPPAAAVQAKPAKPAEPDPDADPFALEPSENTVPARIALSNDVNLRRIIWKHDVVLRNTDSKGKKLYAGGDTAIYTVDTRTITITANPPNRPYIRSSGRKQFCDEIRGNLATEEFEGSGRIEVIPDPETE